MQKNSYPLEQLTLIKKKRLEESERALQEKRLLLEKEEAKFLEVEQDRNAVKLHKDTKLQQLREELDQETTTTKIQQMKVYLKVVDEKLKQKEIKLQEQKKLLDAAKKAVDDARQDMLKRRQEVEKMQLHREEWDKEQKKLLEHKESLESDEIGTVIHLSKKGKNLS